MLRRGDLVAPLQRLRAPWAHVACPHMAHTHVVAHHPPARLVGSGGKGQRGKQHLNEPESRKPEAWLGNATPPKPPEQWSPWSQGPLHGLNVGKVLLEGGEVSGGGAPSAGLSPRRWRLGGPHAGSLCSPPHCSPSRALWSPTNTPPGSLGHLGVLGGAATTPCGSVSAVPTGGATWGGGAAGSERGGGLWRPSGCPRG